MEIVHTTPNALEIKVGYFLHKLNSNFVTKKVFYFLYMPVPMSKYEELKNDFTSAGKNINWTIGMIEKPKMFGYSWIGLSDVTGDTKIEGDFVAYKMVGNYTQFKSAWKKIMNDYPKMTEAYHLYLTDPNVTKMEENITYIVFR